MPGFADFFFGGGEPESPRHSGLSRDELERIKFQMLQDGRPDAAARASELQARLPQPAQQLPAEVEQQLLAQPQQPSGNPFAALFGSFFSGRDHLENALAQPQGGRRRR